MFACAVPRLGILLHMAMIAIDAYAWTNNDWREASVQLNWNITKFLNTYKLEEFHGLFSANTEVVWPGLPVAGRKDVGQEDNDILQQDRIQHRYSAFVELLYWSPDMAVIRHVSCIDNTDAIKSTLQGVFMLVRDEDRVRIRLSVYNFY